MSDALPPLLTCSPLNFNTPVDLSNQFATVNIKWKKLGQLSDSYFSFSSKIARPKAFVELHGRNTTIVDHDPTSKWVNGLKVVSWITVLIPIIMLISKIAFRKINNFQEVHKSDEYVSSNLIEEMPNAISENFKNMGNSYFGLFSDGSEMWNVYPIIGSQDQEGNPLLMLQNLTGKSISLNAEQSKALRLAIMQRKGVIDRFVDLP